MDLSKSKILIIGAGPTGLTAALQFAMNGVKVEVVEKRDSPSTLSRAVGILPESLDKLGAKVKAKILAEAMPFNKLNMHVDSKRMLTIDFKDRLDPNEVITGLPQDRTEEIMRDELAILGVDVRYDCAVTEISTNEDVAEVSFSNDKGKFKYDWVVACDGINSVVRKQLGIAYPGYDLDGKWSIADVELKNMGEFASNNVWVKVGKDFDTFVCLPIAKNRIRIISTAENCLDKMPIPIDIDKVNRQGAFEISVRQAETYKKGRVLLAGDAAHCHSPVGGRGMNLGIADAYDAVHAILQGTTSSYSSKRHIEGAKVIKESEGMRKRIMSRNPLIKMMLKFILGTLNKSSWLQDIAMKRVSKL